MKRMLKENRVKSMKKVKLYITVCVLMVVGLLLSSCDTGSFLNAPAKGSLDKNVLANEKGANALLVGAYAAMDGQNISGTWSSGGTNWIYGSLAGGIAHKGSNSGDQPPINSIMKMTHSPNNGFFDDFWVARYEGISRANSVLELLPELKDVSEERKAQLEGEARFLRGHYYFELKRMFNNVPYIDEQTTEYKQPNTGEGAADIWQKIEEDFTFAKDN